MDYTQLYTPDQIKDAIHHQASLLYFSSLSCNVCKVLKPKVAEMITKDFPEIRLYYIDIELSPALSGQYSIFSIPSILIFFDGKEFFRKSRNISLADLKKEIERPYYLLFE